MRNMSFSLTTDSIIERRKTVTRRLGWTFLKPGDLVRAVHKSQGLARGQHPIPLAVLRIIKVSREPLDQVSQWCDEVEMQREGFADTPDKFVSVFCKANGCKPDVVITRIEFEYAEEEGHA